MSAAHYKLDNRIGLLDYNGIQIDGFVEDVMNVGSLEDKFAAFGWETLSIDGNNMEEIVGALDEAKKVTGKPVIIIGKTLLGKGVSIFENNPKYHGVAPSDEELKVALKELGE
jgi:transketolase